MLGGLLFVRLKAAEQALKVGRIDDAYRMAGEPDIAHHPRGVRVRTGLARAFLDRARAHYRAERFTEALLDIGKAADCGGLAAEVRELREQVMTVAQEVARQKADQRRRLEEARRFMDRGSLAAAQRLIADETGNAELDALGKEMADRRTRVEELVAQAESCLKQGHVDEAVNRILEIRKLDSHHDRTRQLETQVCDHVLAAALRAFETGRLAKTGSELDRLRTLGRHRTDLADVTDALNLAGEAARAFTDRRFEALDVLLTRLRNRCPKIAWIKEAAEQVARLEAAIEALQGGPLGEQAMPTAGEGPRNRPRALEETVAIPRERRPGAGARPGTPLANGGDTLPLQFLLLVDGGGSYMLHRGERVTIGRAVSSHPADVPIFSDLSERHADVARVEEDYFVMSPHMLEVSGKRTQHQLLRDGDRVVLGRRAKFTFRVPNRKSPAATMDISDSTKLPNDVRRVVLFRQTAMIGRGSNCHVTCHTALSDLVLYERGGGLWVRPSGRGRGGDEAVAIELGHRVEMEGVSFVLQPWSVRTGGLV